MLRPIVSTILLLAAICSANTGISQIELREHARVFRGEVTLADVSKFDEDDPTLAPIAGIVILRLDSTAAGTVRIEQLRHAVQLAGVNIGLVNFRGPRECRVSRFDVDPRTLNQPADARPVPTVSSEDEPAGRAVEGRSLRSKLLEDIAVRLDLPLDSLEVQFRTEDVNLLQRPVENDSVQFVARRFGDLGRWQWDVTVLEAGRPIRKSIEAEVRAWQDQLVLTRPVAMRQVLTAADFERRRQLVDRLGNDRPIDEAAAVGQAAARDLAPGTVLTSRLVQAVALVRTNQPVLAITRHGAIELKSNMISMNNGSLGQSVKVRSEQTRETFLAVVTGPGEVTIANAGE